MTDDEPTRLMIDIETLGTDPGAVILSIGAVYFDSDGLGETFHEQISAESCQACGLSIDADTLKWWLTQNDDGSVPDVLLGGRPLPEVLTDFIEFAHPADEVWAYPPSFDCAIIEAAYEELSGFTEPWTYQDTRDARTLRHLSVWPDIEQKGTQHDALDDAIYQARETRLALQYIGEMSGEVPESARPEKAFEVDLFPEDTVRPLGEDGDDAE